MTEPSIAPEVSFFEQLFTGLPEQIAHFDEAELTFDYFFSRQQSQTLLVFLPSAMRKDARRVPAFHRWSWSRHLKEFDVLCVSDPTVRLHEDVLGGWLLGNSQTWALEQMLTHVGKLQENLGYQNVVFCGSSLGGFCALQAAAKASEFGVTLGTGGAYAENPQINLMTYQVAAAIDLLARVGFGAIDRHQVDQEFVSRFSVVDTMRRSSSIPRGLVVIKESDHHHFNEQVPVLEDFLEEQKSCAIQVEVISAEEDATGHTPLTITQMKERILTLLAR